ncbi:hypothetical protein L1F30_13415 [Simiduia sp. 21SJ11W-1]|uniref:hypothetical protein n=1 Tax=Simiduia sp. 21SJ11W-1 TaxID=2909669 RepID=UPI00209EC2C6|nr:hypothetical protein [Simiduia sp. 21SJ11W-1]UTA47156.1 hypothetical protein L1F30_13415 [Simiduia sp. 21SJ11W-1]
MGNNLSSIMFYVFSAAYLFLVGGSIYGFFVNEISVFQYTLTGWSKNLLCLFGILIAGAVAAYPIVLAVYRAFSLGGK